MKPLIILCEVLLCWAGVSAAKDAPTQRGCPNSLSEYSQVLDAYFSHARGGASSAIVLRVYGGLLPEYEIVIDAKQSTHAIFRYAPARAIQWNVYSLAQPHLPMGQYKAEALKIPFTRAEFEVGESKLQDLLADANAIDTSVCEHFPLKDSKGHSHLVKDATLFEIIADSGSKRTRVTDTSGFDLISQNPALLKWGTAMRDAFGTTAVDH